MTWSVQLRLPWSCEVILIEHGMQATVPTMLHQAGTCRSEVVYEDSPEWAACKSALQEFLDDVREPRKDVARPMEGLQRPQKGLQAAQVRRT